MSAVTLLLISLPKTTRGIEDEKFLRYISQVENSHGKTGKHGEISEWQILPSTWRMHSKIDITNAGDAEYHRVALRILRYNRKVLKSRGIIADTYNLALAWNCGPYFRDPKPQSLAYAIRVLNLANETEVRR